MPRPDGGKRKKQRLSKPYIGSAIKREREREREREETVIDENS